jgi:hypothetical protein
MASVEDISQHKTLSSNWDTAKNIYVCVCVCVCVCVHISTF